MKRGPDAAVERQRVLLSEKRRGHPEELLTRWEQLEKTWPAQLERFLP